MSAPWMPGQLPGVGLNKLYHVKALAAATLARVYPIWGKRRKDHVLHHRDVHIVNCGGFRRSKIVGHRVGGFTRGDYAEQGMMTPSPLKAPILNRLSRHNL